ncbi:phosphotransferase [Alteromonas sp. C1M14]|uniref:phosphotransferase n=1 Tax=Alteromonas sp. C1M14 TaxID=2841567 RepID=UPI001C08A940|nr:phosphotransferase [Alteromonas sp. C1M14]MBU2976705.1 ecdysteroid 22-kinase family protein [Alteromonas sp. C1M14]
MTQAISPQLIDWLEALCKVKVATSTLIQPLWSNYGACFRVTTTQGHRWVVKAVLYTEQHQHPKGWQSSHSHERKRHSFVVEHYFYQYLQPKTSPFCYCPVLIASDTKENGHILVLEDLVDLGFTQTSPSLTVDNAVCVIKWLAAFHARFVGYNDDNVWQEGTYWHLATRQDEWRAMAPSRLKDAAHSMANTLAACPYQTLLHGDAKVANFCFTPAMNKCAAVDFQYTGHGVGVKDLAYFIGSALSEEDQAHYTEYCLNLYFSALATHLSSTLDKEEIRTLVSQWRQLYPIACADFHRFLAGWSPEHWKINNHLRGLSEQVLNSLN